MEFLHFAKVIKMKTHYDIKLLLILILEIFVLYYTSRSINQYTSNLLCNILYIFLVKHIGNLTHRLNVYHKPNCRDLKEKMSSLQGSNNIKYRQKIIAYDIAQCCLSSNYKVKYK
jgi:hypothetical protein